MEVVEKGDKIYECDTCGCKFKITSDKEINRFDKQLVQIGAFLPKWEYRNCYSVKCPQCGERIIIKWC